MSNGFWLTKKRHEQFKSGNTITEKVMTYIKTWEERCYSDIPDDIPDLLMNSGLAPCYRLITIAILKNDMRLLGYNQVSDYYYLLRQKEETAQLDIFREV